MFGQVASKMMIEVEQVLKKAKFYKVISTRLSKSANVNLPAVICVAIFKNCMKACKSVQQQSHFEIIAVIKPVLELSMFDSSPQACA